MENNQKKTNAIDYEKLYRNTYKNLPNIYYLVTRILLTVATTVTAITMLACGDDDLIGAGIAIGILGFFVSWGIAALLRFSIAVGLSRGIVVADSVLAIRDGDIAASNANTLNIEEELPEL